MQNRYVGDIGDYVKLAILRALAHDRRLGIAWWLVPDEQHNGDGGHREYLRRPDEWKRFDPDLFEALARIEQAAQRDVHALEAAKLFPNVVFASDPVPCDLQPFAERPAARQRWLSAIRDRLQDCELVFVDPDNGLATPGLRLTLRRAGKSAFIEEIRGLTESHRPVVVYHHQTRRRGGHHMELHHIAAELRNGGLTVSGVLRAKPWSPRAFFILYGDGALQTRAERIVRDWDGWISWHPAP